MDFQPLGPLTSLVEETADVHMGPTPASLFVADSPLANKLLKKRLALYLIVAGQRLRSPAQHVHLLHLLPALPLAAALP